MIDMKKITTEIIESFNCYLINEEKAQANKKSFNRLQTAAEEIP